MLGELELEVAPLVAGQRAGRQVELEVPAPELGLELRLPDHVEHLPALQRGHQRAVDEVELHLETGHRLVAGERMLAQHHRQRVEATLHPAAVGLPVASTEQGPVDVLAHAGAASLGSGATGRDRAIGLTATRLSTVTYA